MMIDKKILLLLLVISVFFCSQVSSQVYSNKIIGEKNEARVDSLKNTEYPYALPIWGQEATARGFSLPYSAGISVNYFWQESAIIINNLNIGFNNGPMQNVDEIIRFDDAVADAKSINLRPDIWLFPFLNVYAILAQAKTSTAIDAGLWLPNADGSWSKEGSISTVANFDATAFGFGITPTLGVGGGWIALDMNFVWTDVSALDKPVYTFVFGPRLGKTFEFNDPDMNLAFWVGGFRVNFSSETSGSINLSELADTDGLQAKVDQGMIALDDKSQEVEAWWNGLDPVEQMNPVNRARYEAANKALGKAGNLLNSLDGALNDGQSATVQYSLDKSLKDKWNFIVGTQFQFNKHWMIRAEYGFLGSRDQFITGLQYRFGL